MKHDRAGADIDTDGDVDITDIALMLAALGACVGDANYNAAAGLDGDGCVTEAEFDYVVDMFNQAAGAVRLAYDGENRLIRYEPQQPRDFDRKLEFAYDALGRRIEKRVHTYVSGSWGNPEITHFVWSDWLLLLELDGRDLDSDGRPDNAILRKYTWGPDVSGEMEAAGGVGGLLAMQDPEHGKDFVYFYDAAGNVSELVRECSKSSEHRCMTSSAVTSCHGELGDSRRNRRFRLPVRLRHAHSSRAARWTRAPL